MTGAMVATGIVFSRRAALPVRARQGHHHPEGHGDHCVCAGRHQARVGTLPTRRRTAHPRHTHCRLASVASLFVDSSAPGADIEVDDAFVGSTPSSVSVTPGPHTIAVKKKGYAAWSRKMNVAGAGAKVMTELEPIK